MAGRSRRTAARRTTKNQAEAAAAERDETHVERMVASAVRVKKADSTQIRGGREEDFGALFGDKAIRPPLPLEDLWSIYESNAIHAGCIDAKVVDSVGRGWKLEAEDDGEVDDDDAKAVRRRLAEHLQTLASPPGSDPDMSFSKLLKQLVRERDAMGWGAWEVGRDQAKKITELWPLPGHTLAATKDPAVYVQVRGEEKVFFRAFGAGEKPDKPGSVSKTKGHKDWGDKSAAVEEGDEANEILVFKHYTPRSDFYGIPPWISGVPPVAEFRTIREYNVEWFESGGTGDRLLHYTAKEAEVAQKLADAAVDQFEEAKGTGHTTVVSHGDETTKVAVEHLSPEVGKRDGQFQNRREDLIVETLIAHQVPGYRIGWAIEGTLGGNAAKEMLDAYRYGAVEPIQEDVELLLAATLFNKDAGGFDLQGYRFVFVELDWDDMALDIEKAQFAVEFGLATPNEGREMIGLERGDDPALDRLYYKGQPIGEGMSDATDVLREFQRSMAAVVKSREEDFAARVEEAVEARMAEQQVGKRRFLRRAA